MTAKTLDELKEARSRITYVLGWHTAGPPRNGVRRCKECGTVHPCRTRLMLLGDKTRALESAVEKALIRRAGMLHCP